MPKVKNDSVWFTSHIDGHNFMNYEIHVNSKGMFYARLDAKEFKEIASEIFKYKKISGKFINCFHKDIDKIHDMVYSVFKLSREPEVKTSIVILYNIESHVKFAEKPNGEITRHAEIDGSKWINYNDKRYGLHHSSEPSKGGYSLTIGARVYYKDVYTLGDKTKTKYRFYDGSEAEAKQLNRWCSFSLPDDAKEMIYTGKSALFFDNLMYGMATISKKIQEMTSNDSNLLMLINNDIKLLS